MGEPADALIAEVDDVDRISAIDGERVDQRSAVPVPRRTAYGDVLTGRDEPWPPACRLDDEESRSYPSFAQERDSPSVRRPNWLRVLRTVCGCGDAAAVGAVRRNRPELTIGGEGN